jgi:hypothetical protein
LGPELSDKDGAELISEEGAELISEEGAELISDGAELISDGAELIADERLSEGIEDKLLKDEDAGHSSTVEEPSAQASSPFCSPALYMQPTFGITCGWSAMFSSYIKDSRI